VTGSGADRSSLTEALARHAFGLAAGVGALEPDGPPTTPRTLVASDGGRRLYRYLPAEGAPADWRPPLLLVYALVNRPLVLDLAPERSVVRALVASGLDVYLLDWGDPRAGEAHFGFEDYALRLLGDAVAEVARASRVQRVHLMGICQGGVLALCHAAYSPETIASLTTTVTPVDFRTGDDRLSSLVRHVDADLIRQNGMPVPGAALNQIFLALKPAELGHRKYVDLAGRLATPGAMRDFLAMERWIADSPDQPSRMLAEFIDRFYHRNVLVDGTLTLAEEPVDLARLPVPVFNVYARDDHIVPPAASRALAGLIAPERYRELEVPGGHIGLYVGRRALEQVPAAVATFVHETDPEGERASRG